MKLSEVLNETEEMAMRAAQQVAIYALRAVIVAALLVAIGLSWLILRPQPAWVQRAAALLGLRRVVRTTEIPID
jgi:hypothetical protein